MTDTRQSNIEESIATERERDELRRRIDRALTIAEDPDSYPDDDAALDLMASILRGEGGLGAGEHTATHTGPLTAEQLADSLRDGVPVHRFVADPDAAGPEPDFPERTPEQVEADERARLDTLAEGTG